MMLLFYLTAMLLPISVLPPAFLQYLSFSPVLTDRTRQQVICGYLVILAAETILSFFIFSRYTAVSRFSLCRNFYFVAWLPYFLWAIYTIRPYFFRHLFLLLNRMIFMMALYQVCIFLLGSLFDYLPLEHTWMIPAGITLYTLCYSAVLPSFSRFFRELFLDYEAASTPAFWKYSSLLPALLLANNIFFVLTNEPLSVYWRFVLPRMVSAAVALLICLSVRAGLHQAKKEMLAAQHNEALTAQVQNSHAYVDSLQQSQREMAKFCQQRRQYFAKLTQLIRQNQFTQALDFSKKIGMKLDNTKRRLYCKDPIIDAALATYLQRAAKEKIPLTVRIQLPALSVSFSSDLSMVLANLVENAVQASEKQPPLARSLALLILEQGDVLNILVKNRFDAPVEFGPDHLPVTHKAGHGLGMKSLLAFRDNHQATVLCSQENGWFSTYIQVKSP